MKAFLIILFCWKMENLDLNNKSNKSEAEITIKLKDKINWDKVICQIERASSQR